MPMSPLLTLLGGAMVGDWPSAFRILERLDDAADLTDKHRTTFKRSIQIRVWARGAAATARSRRNNSPLGPDVTRAVGCAPIGHLRRDLVATLAELADPRSVDLLVTTLGDDYSRVRRKAITALVWKALLAALDNDQSQVRKHALSSAWVRSADRPIWPRA